MAPKRRVLASLAISIVLALLLGACTSSGSSKAKAKARRVDLAGAGAATFTAGGSVGQVYVTGAPKGTDLELVHDGAVVAHVPADAHGSLIFRKVPVGTGYRVAAGTGSALVASKPLSVTSWTDAPAESAYAAQKIGDGYGYLRTRDGTLLSMTVKLPGPADKGPYPTVIEYSGYSPANPKSPQPSSLIASGLGYATVGINMRGTGCSGGAFDYFEQLQSTDGYDAVETIAAQPWVAHHKVGLVGLSYPGISQLFVAQLQPPHLAAIAPLSVINDTIKGTLSPGGVLNTGFAVAWAKDRQHDAQPAPGGGQGWATDRIEAGDKTCLANQALHSQAVDPVEKIETQKYWTDEIGLPLSPEHFVQKIDVPVYLAADWQDEQTGGSAANLFDKFTGTNDAWFTAQNGGHADPLDPTVFARWVQFLSIFVAEEVPHQDALDGPRRVHDRERGVRHERAAAARPVRQRDELRRGEADVRGVSARAHPVRERRRRRSGRTHAALRSELRQVARVDGNDKRGTSDRTEPSCRRRRRRVAPTRTCTTLRTCTTRRCRPTTRRARGRRCRRGTGSRPRPAPRCPTRRRRSRKTLRSSGTRASISG